MFVDVDQLADLAGCALALILGIVPVHQVRLTETSTAGREVLGAGKECAPIPDFFNVLVQGCRALVPDGRHLVWVLFGFPTSFW